MKDNFKTIINDKSKVSLTKDLLAMYLYTYFPPRQRRDYYEMIYVNMLSDDVKNMNKNVNYVTQDKKFIFNNYKNMNKYNQQIFDYPDEIYDLIKFINYQNSERLFIIDKDYKFSEYISQIFDTHSLNDTGLWPGEQKDIPHMNIREIRKSYVKFIKDQLKSKVITSNDYDNMIIKMGGSIESELPNLD